MRPPPPGRRLAASWGLVMGLVLGGCASSGSAPSPTPATGGETVARVGALSIPRSLFEVRVRSACAAIAGGGGRCGSTTAMDRQVRTRVTSSLIMDAVIGLEAQARGVAASDQEVQAAVDHEASAAGGSDHLQSELAQLGGSVDQLRDEFRSRINEQRLEDVLAAERARALLARLHQGGDFGVVARQSSDDAGSAAGGGARGEVARQQLKAEDSAVADALAALPPGATVGAPVRDSAGYELLRLDAGTATTVTYHRILVAAPSPYTVRERPTWFNTAILDAIAQFCSRGQLQVLDPSLPAPCLSASQPPNAVPAPSGSPTGTASPR